MSVNGHDFSTRGMPRTKQRRTGLYRKHRNNRVLVASEGECTTPVHIRRATMTGIGLEAAYRKMPPQELLGRLIDIIEEDDLYTAILGDRDDGMDRKAAD